MTEEGIKTWMTNLLKRFGGDYAVGQVEVEVVCDKEEHTVQVDFILDSNYKGFFACSKLMESITEDVNNSSITGRLDDMKELFVVIRQDKKFVVEEIKEERDALLSKRRDRARRSAGRD